METFFALLALCAGNSPVTDEFPSQRPVTLSFDVFFFIFAWINAWVNNREAGDLRHNHVQYDVTVMVTSFALEQSYDTQIGANQFNVNKLLIDTLSVNEKNGPDM